MATYRSTTATSVRALVLAATITFLSWGAAQVPAIPAGPETVLTALNESPGEWADAAIEVVVGRGLYIGYPDGTFGWRDDITRAEMAVVIARLLSAFDLDSFDPREQQVLKEAVRSLDAELAGVLEEVAALRRAVAAHDGQLTDLAAADAATRATIEALALTVDDHEGRLRVLEEALATVRGAAGEAELAAFQQELSRLGDVVGSLERRIGALESGPATPSAEVTEADLAALAAEIAAAREAVAALERQGGGLQSRVAVLEATLGGLAGDEDDDGQAAIEALGTSLGSISSSLGEARADTVDLAERVDQLEAEQAELVERVDKMEADLLPDRAGFYVSLAAMGADPSLGMLGKVSVGHDSLLANIGFRVSYEHAFGPFASNASALATYTTSFGASDAYVGLGAGVSFEASPVLFGEMTLGIGYRLSRHLGLFVEGRYRPFFDGANQQFGGIGGGVQVRF